MKHGSVRKFFLRLALLIGALVAALAVFILEENIRGRILLSRYKTELRAKGEKLTLAELDLAPLHAESNDVAILVATGVDLLPFGNPRPDNAILPASITPILARVEPLTHSDKPLLAVDYESYPRVRNFEEVKALFGVAGWLSVAALDAARRGDRIGAVERVSEIISFGKRLRHERVQTSQHDRVNLLIRALDVSWRLLQTNGWIDDELARFQQVWSEPFPLDDVLDIDEVERAMQLRVVDRRQASISEWWKYVRANMSDREDDDDRYPFSLLADVAAVADGIWYLTQINSEERRLLERWQIRMEAGRRVVRAGAVCEVFRHFGQSPEAGGRPDSAQIHEWQSASPGNALLIVAMQIDTRREMTVAATALKRYQLRHGSLPATLAALVPEFLTTAPRDWMDGQPLRYRLINDAQVLLYSVGRDCKDDGGDSSTVQEHRPEDILFIRSPWTAMWRGRDAVWPQPATPADLAH